MINRRGWRSCSNGVCMWEQWDSHSTGEVWMSQLNCLGWQEAGSHSDLRNMTVITDTINKAGRDGLGEAIKSHLIYWSKSNTTVNVWSRSLVCGPYFYSDSLTNVSSFCPTSQELLTMSTVTCPMLVLPYCCLKFLILVCSLGMRSERTSFRFWKKPTNFNQKCPELHMWP